MDAVPSLDSWEVTDGAPAEFRDMVRAFHAAGIEVVLDVVYNHTSEVGAHGPTYSYRGRLSDQLTAYQLAEPDAEQVAFCVFVRRSLRLR